MQQIQWVWEQMKGFRKVFVFALISTAILQGAQLINSVIIQKIVDDVLYQLPENTADRTLMQPLIHTLIILVSCMIAFTVFRTILRYFSNISYESCGQKFLFYVKRDLYDNLQNQDMRFYSKHRTGDLMTRLTGDLEMGKHGIAFTSRGLLECSLLFVVTGGYMLYQDVLFALALLVITPVIFLVTQRFGKRIGPLFGDLRERLSVLNSNAQENIEGNRVVKAFAQEEYEIGKFDEKNKDYRDANLNVTLTWLRFFPVIEGLSQALSVAVLLVGGYFLMIGRINPGVFAAFNSLCWALAAPMRSIGMYINDTQRFFASINKVIELYYMGPRVKNVEKPVKKEGKLTGEIRFDHVTAKMHGNVILKDICLDIKPGETVAVMGSTGSGKTTLINCICRFLDISSGSLTIDGVEVRNYDLNTLRGSIGLANQDVFLFSDTIDGNIAYGDLSLSDDEVHEFARLASAGFITATADGYDTIVGERGTGLSGGQKQRLALARALAVRPSILILDDTTSAVDLETEHEIQQNLKHLDFPCTKIMVAQRTSTTKNADKIVIMDKGRIIECGTHQELLDQHGYYYEVHALQNGGTPQKEVV